MHFGYFICHQIMDGFYKACEDIGKELIRDEAIGLADLEAWRHAENKIVNIGIPSHAFLQCFLRSIKSGSTGFLMRKNFIVFFML